MLTPQSIQQETKTFTDVYCFPDTSVPVLIFAVGHHKMCYYDCD